MKNIKKLGLAVMAFVFASPLLALGQTTYITSISDVERILLFILNWLRTIFFILAALFLILAAFKYLTAQGDEEKVKGAKTMLIYSIVGIAVALLATSIVPVLRNLFSQ